MRRLLSLFLLLTACSGGASMDRRGGRTQAPDPVTVVETVEAAPGTVADLLVTSATVESERQADVLPQTAGIVREVRVELGQTVQQGAVLAVLENVSLSEGARRAGAELERLEADLAELERLYEQGAISRNEVEQLEHQVRTARSSLREASAGSGQARLQAPFEGVVAAVDVRLGQLASSGQRAFQVVDPDQLRVRAQLPERDVGRVAIGQAARLVSAYDASLTAQATVTRVAPVIDPSTGTFEVLLGLPPDQTALRPGQYVAVELEVDRHEGVVTVPKQAVVYEDGSPVVYRVVDAPEPEPDTSDDDEAPAPSSGFSFSFGGGEPPPDDDEADAPASPFVAERVAVDLGLVDDRSAEIVDGVSLGDSIVVVGQSALKDGAPVKTPEMVQADEAAKSTDADTDDGAPG